MGARSWGRNSLRWKLERELGRGGEGGGGRGGGGAGAAGGGDGSHARFSDVFIAW